MIAILKSIWKWIVLDVVGFFKWDWAKGIFHKGKYWDLTKEEWVKIADLLKSDYFIILTRRKTHLTSYLISLANFLKTGKFGYWAHALMNLEGDSPLEGEYDFIEATGSGVHYSRFDRVFDCDSICLLIPKGFTPEEWTMALDRLRTNLGKPYDTLFDLKEDMHLSCIELVRDALAVTPDYQTEFKDFEAMIKKGGNLTPQMVYDSKDFIKILEIRH